MRALFAWLLRTGFLYLLLCLAIGFFVFAWPSVSGRFSGAELRQDAMSVEEVRDLLGDDRRAAQAKLESRVEEARSLGGEALVARIARLRQERQEAVAELSDSDGWLDRIRPSRILANKRLELRIAAITSELAALEILQEKDLREAALARAEASLQRYPRIPTENAIRVSNRLCAEAEQSLASFDSRTEIDRVTRNIFLQERALLETRRDEACEVAEQRAERRRRGLAAKQALSEARTQLAKVQELAVTRLPDPASDISDTSLRDIALRALIALLVILLMPFLIRTIFYYLLAPVVERGPPIRLATASGMADSPETTGASRPSLQVEIGQGEELLVRQSYLQSTPTDARMRTRWLLSRTSPFTSLASGMAFLTEARADGAVFGISARDNALAEITRIDLPSGTAMVMQPRALAAIIQPVDRPMQIRSRWRLFSLHAWLTFQFRYLIFHGPGSLIVKGGRGVRVESAGDGRRFGQDQLIGFSPHTPYTVARSETFLPYLFGREPLFRDRVRDREGGEAGILVLEEAPLTGKGSGAARGMEGAFDAVLKAFGI